MPCVAVCRFCPECTRTKSLKRASCSSRVGGSAISDVAGGAGRPSDDDDDRDERLIRRVCCGRLAGLEREGADWKVRERTVSMGEGCLLEGKTITLVRESLSLPPCINNKYPLSRFYQPRFMHAEVELPAVKGC